MISRLGSLPQLHYYTMLIWKHMFKQNNFKVNNTDLTIEKRGWQRRRRYMKICTLCMHKVRKTLLQSSVAREWQEKVKFDVLMKTCNILSKIMVVLNIYGMKVLVTTTFKLNIIQLFASLFWKIERVSSVLNVVLVCLLFFASKHCIESGGKSRRMKVFYFADEILLL